MRRQRRAEIVEKRLQTVDVGGRVVPRSDQLGRKLVEHVVRFVRDTRTANHAECIRSVRIDNRVEFLRDVADSFIPGSRDQSATLLVTNERRANARLVVNERMTEAALDAEKLAIEAVNIAVARHDAQQLVAARAERHLAAVGTIGAGGNSLRQLPRARLMAVGAIEQRAGGTNFNAVATLRTVEPAAVGSNHGIGASSAGFDGVFAHPFVADARATFAENATLRIVGHDRGKIFLRIVVFLFDEALFQSTPIESDFLQLTLAAAIADGTIERMIGQQKLQHRALRLFNLIALSGHDHAVGADDGAGGLQLRHLLDAHQAHATRSLQREVGVITERRNVERLVATDVDETRAFGHVKLLAVDGDFDYFSAH